MFAGLVHLDGRPVAARSFARLVARADRDVADGAPAWTRAMIGLARLPGPDAGDRRPPACEDDVHLVADARIDDRAALRARLGPVVAGTGLSDEALILAAWRRWGSDCVEHLRGDFAFALWDARARRLLCARDHLGVKPFFYAEVGEVLVLASSIARVRRHPAVSPEPDEQAIGDFLLFGCNQALDSTALADVRRLPPGHRLEWEPGGPVRVRRYWAAPVDGRVRFARPGEYVERFTEILEQAVADRLRGGPVGISMSGGVDSTAVAAAAVAADPAAPRPLALTNVFERLIPDEEGRYARLAAEHLGMPIRLLAADDWCRFAGIGGSALDMPEPVEEPSADRGDAPGPEEASLRVILTGQGGDPVLRAPGHFVADCLAGGRLGELVRGTWSTLRSCGRLPPLGVRSRLKARLGLAPVLRDPFPAWLQPDFAARCGLDSRWREIALRAPEAGSRHPVRPEAHAAVSNPLWPYLFESLACGEDGPTVEHRHPYFDVRLVEYLLALPPLPWFVDKHLVREAMRGRLPETVRLRPKTPLVRPPVHRVSAELTPARVEALLAVPGLERFVEPAAVPRPGLAAPLGIPPLQWPDMRPVLLGYWLAHRAVDPVVESPERSTA